jgi:signal transduction histidine kinase
MLPLFEAHGRTIDVRLEEGPLIQGNADLLREAIRNVLENALYHGAGTVKMLPAGSGHGTFLLDITDEGNGVPLGLQDEMFQRFRKGQESSAGSGLGLAIVRATLRNAGGDVRFVSTRPCILRMWFQIAS